MLRLAQLGYWDYTEIRRQSSSYSLLTHFSLFQPHPASEKELYTLDELADDSVLSNGHGRRYIEHQQALRHVEIL